MPQHKSAEKRVRQTERRRQHNKYQIVRLRRKLRAVREAGAAGDNEVLVTAVREASQLLDRFACRGYIHKNFAANRKSQMARLLAGGAAH